MWFKVTFINFILMFSNGICVSRSKKPDVIDITKVNVDSGKKLIEKESTQSGSVIFVSRIILDLKKRN